VTFESRARVQVEPLERGDQLRGGAFERLGDLRAEDLQPRSLNFGLGPFGASSGHERSHARGDSRQELVELLDRGRRGSHELQRRFASGSRVDPVEREDMTVNVKMNGTPEMLADRDGPDWCRRWGGGGPEGAGDGSQVRRELVDEHAEHRRFQRPLPSHTRREVERQHEDPLAQRLAGQHEIDEVRRRLGGPSRRATRTKTPVLEGKGDHPLLVTIRTPNANEALRQLTAREKAPQGARREGLHLLVCQEGLELLLDELVQRRELGPAPHVRGRAKGEDSQRRHAGAKSKDRASQEQEPGAVAQVPRSTAVFASQVQAFSAQPAAKRPDSELARRSSRRTERSTACPACAPPASVAENPVVTAFVQLHVVNSRM